MRSVHCSAQRLSLACVFVFVVVAAVTVVLCDDSVVVSGANNVASEMVCPYIDTTNVTSGTRLANGTLYYNNVHIAPELVSTYRHKLVYLNETEPVETHLRACICRVRPCVNVCCPWGSKYSLTNRTCQLTPSNITWPEQLLFNISSRSMDYGVVRENVRLEDYFHIQYVRPCAEMYIYDPVVNYYDEWRLLDNGEIHLIVPDKRLTREQYCFGPHESELQSGIYVIDPVVCDITPDLTTAKHVNSITFIASICFILPTICVYLWLPELRNCLGLSLVCYLSGLIVGYGVLIYHDFFDPDVHSLSCKVVGYTAYYGFMSAFFWLNAISFDVFCGFYRKRLAIETGVQQQRRRFIYYSAYAWCMAFVMLVCTWYAQEYAPLADKLKPGIGGGHFCWLDLRDWAGMIYFYGPLLILTAINIVFFSMIAFKICKVQMEIGKFTANQESASNLQKEQRDNFFVFLRLFLIMGVTWSLEIISYLVGTKHKWTKIFYLTDLCNASLGLLIFLLFVMKKQVRHSIKSRLCPNTTKQSTNTLSTTCSGTSGRNTGSNRSSSSTLNTSI